MKVGFKEFKQRRSLDANAYCWVLCDKIAKKVGSTKENYLWILSRSPQLSQENLIFLLEKAKARGYDVSKLIYVKQN